MSKKKNKKVKDSEEEEEEEEEKNDANEHTDKSNQKGEENGGKKERNGGNAAVFKVDLHCDGCASKIVKCIRGFQGVETVSVDGGSGKITVTGKVDPLKIQEKLEEKTHKKVELLSPAPKKDKEKAKSKNDDAAEGKVEKKKDSSSKDNNNAKKNDQKNSKEPQITTAVLKVALHCEGCIQKIHKIVSKTKGYQEMKLDKQKDLVTVKGAMDMKELADTLKKHLKRDVEIVSPKKDDKKEKGDSGGGGGSGEGKGAGGGKGKSSGSGSGSGGDGGEKMEGGKMLPPQQGQFGPFGYGYPSPSPSPFIYGGGAAYVGDPYQFHYHAPQMFSDENPNACTVM